MLKHSHLILFSSLFIFIILCFSLIVIKNFTVPLMGWVGFGSFYSINHDFVDLQEYTGFYLAKNLSFNPFPHLNLITNQSFYPYGINGVFQPWSIEKDYFYALLYHLFGWGPWLQIYYLLTVLITAIGSLVLLIREYGFYQAAGFGIFVSLGNFYAINKYPHHLQHSTIHWLTLGIIVDFLIVRYVTLKQHVSLWLVLTRVALLFLLIGHDLGYVAGFGLMSFTVSFFFIAGLLCYRLWRRKLNIKEWLNQEKQSYYNDWRTYPRLCLALISITFISIYLYLPLDLQIFQNAKQSDFGNIISQPYWVNPLRLLIPFFPKVNPSNKRFELLLQDSPESLSDGSPGWFLLILGLLGLWQSRHKKIFMYFPLLIVFIFCLTYHPILFPTLKIFPWFVFNRVSGRSTMIYAVILALFSLNVNLNWFTAQKKKWVVGLLVGLAVIEISVAYSFRQEYQPYVPNQSFYDYMSYVKQKPGEAVLDWPFCATGSGDGGKHRLCPYYVQNSGIFALRRFHEKKVMGQYFGRLHPSQAQPYIEAGWNKLFFPDSKSNQQKRCFNPEEWSFFTEFFKLNDFAGINLYVDLIPKQCLDEFYKKFGNPTIETTIPEVGRVQFLAKSHELRKQVNPGLGRHIKLD